MPRLTTQIQTSNIEINQYTPLRHKLCTINEDSSNNNLLNSRNVEIFKCMCKCHSDSSNNFSLSNSIHYKIISRQVAYSLRKLVMGNLVSYSDSPSKQQIHFAINKMLNCICNKNHILNNIPVSLFLCKLEISIYILIQLNCVSCILNASKDILIKEFLLKVSFKLVKLH